MIQLHLKIKMSNQNQTESYNFMKCNPSIDEITAKTHELLLKFDAGNVTLEMGY